MNDVVKKSKGALGPADQRLVKEVFARQPRALAQAITLIESTRADHQERAAAILEALLPHTGHAIRIGITGSPGAGKSTLIEALGLHVVDLGHRVAVLAVDPSSSISGGSILGDKTRMEQLARRPEAFIRGSPSGGSLGGVAEKTREGILVCEAAGFDVILVETVGVGQSETTVAGMVDMFVLVQLPNAGDELQAMKKGIVELADVLVINKADVDPAAAERTQHQFAGALSMLRSMSAHWRPPVLVVSAVAHTGIDRFWAEVRRFRDTMVESGEFEAKRRRQALDWMWALIDSGLRNRFRNDPQVRQDLEALSCAVRDGQMAPAAAASRLLGYMNPDSPNEPEA
jgi:LAO/AO transport system kinase